MDFIALDVETANAGLASICQLGIVTFRSGRVVDQWQTLVNPEDYFDGINVAIHDITDKMVKDAPTFPPVLRHYAAHSRAISSSRTCYSTTSR